jgi:hypothetical protein
MGSHDLFGGLLSHRLRWRDLQSALEHLAEHPAGLIGNRFIAERACRCGSAQPGAGMI